MENIKELAKKITSKDEKAALAVCRQMIDEGNAELFQELVKQTEYLFPFVRDNVADRLEKSVCKANYENLYKFSDIYSPDYACVIIAAFRYFGDDDTPGRMLDYLRNGSVAQKTYAARYFEISPNLYAVKELIANAFSEEEYLNDACAAALGVLNEQVSYDTALEKLNSKDDFSALSALNFFVNYAKNPPMEDILKALAVSGMPENFAGTVIYLKPLSEFIKDDLKNALVILENIINGFGEILPLSEVFNFELYQVLSELAQIQDSEYSSKISVVLLNAKNKIEMLCSNSEYTFDEDKNTKDELKEIEKLLKSFDGSFWANHKNNVSEELSKDKNDVMAALQVIKDCKISSAAPKILETIYENTDETLLCEAFNTLKELKALSYIDKDEALEMFSNDTIRAIVESYYN